MADDQPSREERELAKQRARFEGTRAKLAEAQYAKERSTYNAAEKAKFFIRRKSPYIKFFLFLLILGLVGFVLYGFFQTGLGESYYEKVSVAASESAIGQTVSAWYHQFAGALNPETYAFSNPQANEIKIEQPIGVAIKELTSRKTLYKQNEPIDLTASVEVQGVDKELNIKFTCEIDSYDNTKSKAKISEEDKVGNVVETKIEKDQTKLLQIGCNFPIEGQYPNFTEEEASDEAFW